MEVNLYDWSEQLVPWLLNHGTRIIFIAIGSFILNLILARVIKRAVRVAVVSSKTMSEEAEVQREDTLIRIFSRSLTIVILIMAILMIITELGIEIGPILAGAGIVGLAFGFGGQYLIRDIISGLFIILENQYRIGDVIKIADTGGVVEDITLRMTTLRDMDGTVHHIPHGEIKKVSNLSMGFAKVNFDIGISYNADIEHVIKVIDATGKQLASDPEFEDMINEPPHFLRIDKFDNSSVVVKIVGQTKPLKQWEVTGELRKRIKIAFDKEGIEIPFPQIVVHKKKLTE